MLGAPLIRGFRMSGLTVKQLGESLFHHLHHHRRISHFRLGDQKVEMFGHHHVAEYHKAILLPGALHDTQEQVTPLGAVKLWTALIAAAGYEVKVVATIPPLQASRHAPNVSAADCPRL